MIFTNAEEPSAPLLLHDATDAQCNRATDLLNSRGNVRLDVQLMHGANAQRMHHATVQQAGIPIG